MKISKLFHWLYAFLMLLPCFFIGVNAIYYGFNDNAVSQTYTKEEPIYYESNEVNTYDDLLVGNIYSLSYNDYLPTYSSNLMLFEVEYNSLLPNYDSSLVNPRVYMYSLTNGYLYYYNTSGEVYTSNIDFHTTYYFVLKSLNNQNRDFINDYVIPYISFTNYKYVKQYEEVTYTNGIVDSLVQATERTFDLPMFSWTNDNFIVAPFAYLSGLFGIQSGNVFVLFLDYWATISIIYLCFDIVMYVPLLAHRWIDKAVIE